MILVDKQSSAIEIWKQLRENPGAFENLAQTNSMDSSTASLGGLLAQPITRHSTPQNLSDAVFRQLVDGDPRDQDPSRKPKDGDFTGPIQVGERRWVLMRRESLVATDPKVDLKGNVKLSVTPEQDDPAAKADADGSTAIEPGRDRRSPPGLNLRSGTNSPRVVWAELNSAAENFRTLAALQRTGSVESGRVALARGEVEALAAELSSCADDLRDEVELLQAQLAIRKADVQAAEGHVAKATGEYKNTENLFKKGRVVSQNELRSFQHEVDIRSAELAKKQAEMNEVVIRIKQATRRHDEAIELTERAKGLVPEREAPQRPAAPALKR
jgi:hypothetical protein